MRRRKARSTLFGLLSCNTLTPRLRNTDYSLHLTLDPKQSDELKHAKIESRVGEQATGAASLVLKYRS